MENGYSISRAPSLYHKRAQAKSLAGDCYEALFLYRKAFEESPRDQEYAIDYAHNYTALGCYEESNNVLLSVLYSDCEELPPDYYYIMGCNFTGMRCFGAALDCFECYLATGEQNDGRDASQTMMEALRSGDVLFDGDMEMFFLTAREDVRGILDMLGKKDYPAAVKAAESEITDEKIWAAVMNFCASTMYENGLTSRATELCENILSRKKDDVMALCHLITLNFREYGKLPPQETLDRLLEAKLSAQEEYMCAAGTLGALGMHEQALPRLLRLMDFQPNDRENLHNLAVCHFNCKSYDKALAVWTKLQKLYPMSIVASYCIEKTDEAIKNGGAESMSYGYGCALPLEVFMQRLTELSQSANNDNALLQCLYYAVQALSMPFQTLAIANTVRVRSVKKAREFLHELLFYPRVAEEVKSYAKIYLELSGEYFDHYAASADGLSAIASPLTETADIAPYTQIVWLILNGIDEIKSLRRQQRAVVLLRNYMLAQKKLKKPLGFAGMESAFAAACEYIASGEQSGVTQASMIDKYQTTVYRFKKALENISRSAKHAGEGESDEQHA